MVDRLPWRSGKEQQEEDETNFLPLPEIRIPGTVDWAPFQGQGQTQYWRAAEPTGTEEELRGEGRWWSKPVIGHRPEGQRSRGFYGGIMEKWEPQNKQIPSWFILD